jgi:hypothetical protein
MEREQPARMGSQLGKSLATKAGTVLQIRNQSGLFIDMTIPSEMP